MHLGETSQVNTPTDSSWNRVLFDDSPNQIKGRKDNIFTKEIISCFNTNTTRYPFKKELSWMELLSYNSPSCCLRSTNLFMGIQYGFLEKEKFRELACSRT